MSAVKEALNELLVNVFNYITNIEELNLKNRGVSASMTEVHIIEAIDNTEEPIMTNVANKLLITVGTLTTAINSLVRKGYVERVQSVDDRRKVFLKLTSRGRDVKRLHDEFHDDMIENTIRDLKIEEDSELITALENIQKYFRHKYEDRVDRLKNNKVENK